MSRYQSLLSQLRLRYPGFRVVHKRRSRLHRAIHYGLLVVTAGQMRTYLDDYQTTIGRTVYVTDAWDELSEEERYVTMRHEAVHIEQFRRYTVVGMAILYLLVPLPMGLAWWRAYFEKQAYAESICAAAEVWGLDAVRAGPYRSHILAQFTGASYGWMWPFPGALDRWYDGVLARL